MYNLSALCIIKLLYLFLHANDFGFILCQKVISFHTHYSFTSSSIFQSTKSMICVKKKYGNSNLQNLLLIFFIYIRESYLHTFTRVFRNITKRPTKRQQQRLNYTGIFVRKDINIYICIL